ncbi:MAG: hypothetical protein GX751_06645 [Desulfuromonadaceae bacterium]|nr:hypothetical protein [Desulfuromonadaceae bacterium]
MDKFIRGHSVSFMSEGKPYGEVRQIEFVGRKAKIFESISHRNLSGRDIHPAIVAIYQKFIVIPARKGEGFYALRLSVPFEIKNAYLGTFEELSKSFLPGD